MQKFLLLVVVVFLHYHIKTKVFKKTQVHVAQPCKAFVFSKPHGQFLIVPIEVHMCSFPANV